MLSVYGLVMCVAVLYYVFLMCVDVRGRVLSCAVVTCCVLFRFGLFYIGLLTCIMISFVLLCVIVW